MTLAEELSFTRLCHEELSREKVSRGEPVVYAPFGYLNADKTYIIDDNIYLGNSLHSRQRISCVAQFFWLVLCNLLESVNF